MDKKTKNILQYVFWAAVAVVLVVICIKAIDWKEFIGALKVCKWEYVAVAFVIGCIFIVVRGIRWHMLIKPIDPAITTAAVVNAYGIGFLANLVLPRAGEVVKIGYVVKNSKHSWDAILGTYLVEKAVDAIVLLGLVGAFIIGAWGKENLEFGSGGPMVWGTEALAAGLVLFVLLCYWLRNRGGLWGKCWGFIAGIGKGLNTFRHMDKPWLFLLYTALIWISFWLTSACMVWALRDIDPFTQLSGFDAFNYMVAGSASTLIPVPGGFGAYHGAVATVMQVLNGIPLSSGMIYATLNHETQMLAQVVVGFWGYIRETFVRK